jgi:hypothetical protein
MYAHTRLHHAKWVKSTRSAINNECVEVCELGDAIAVRDSKSRTAHLVFSKSAWQSFLDGIHAGDFDRGRL